MFASLLCTTCDIAEGDAMEIVESSPTVPGTNIEARISEQHLPERPEKVASQREDYLSEQSTISPRENSSVGSGAIGASSLSADANDVLVAEVQHELSKWSQDQAIPSVQRAGTTPDPIGTATGLTLPSSACRHHPKFSQRKASTGLLRECAALPLPSAPSGRKPLVSEKLPGLDINSIQTSLQAEEGPVQRFMAEILGCSQFDTTPWAAKCTDLTKRDESIKGAKTPSIFFQRSRYRALLPSDIPSSVAKLIGIPDAVDARSLFALCRNDGQLVLVQQSMVQGIMFSDRFRLQNTFSFMEEADGVLLSQWCEVIWDKPLPWTHTPVKMFVEKKAKAEAKSTFRDFAKIIQEDAR